MTIFTYPQSSNGGGSGANTTLSNLTSPTAINQPLRAPSGDDLIIGAAANSTIFTSSGTGTAENLQLIADTDTSNPATATTVGSTYVSTSNITIGSLGSGNTYVASGYAVDANSGTVKITSGSIGANIPGNPGSADVNVPGITGTSGGVFITTGDHSDNGNTGGIIIQPGYPWNNGIPGSISLNSSTNIGGGTAQLNIQFGSMQTLNLSAANASTNSIDGNSPILSNDGVFSISAKRIRYPTTDGNNLVTIRPPKVSLALAASATDTGLVLPSTSFHSYNIKYTAVTNDANRFVKTGILSFSNPIGNPAQINLTETVLSVNTLFPSANFLFSFTANSTVINLQYVNNHTNPIVVQFVVEAEEAFV